MHACSNAKKCPVSICNLMQSWTCLKMLRISFHHYSYQNARIGWCLLCSAFKQATRIRFPTGETLAVCREMKEGQYVKEKYGGSHYP